MTSVTTDVGTAPPIGMVEALWFIDINYVMFTKRTHWNIVYGVKDFQVTTGVLFINSTIGSRILKTMWGTPLHPRRKKTPSQATVGFSENEVSILFCYWAGLHVFVWVWQEVKKHTHTINNDIW